TMLVSVRASMTLRRAIGSLALAATVGLMFGASCVTSSGEAMTSAVPDEVPLDPTDQAAAEPELVVAEPQVPERPPPWRPPQEPLLEGVEGAGQLLAAGDPRAALARLTELDKLDVLDGEADLDPE